MAGVPPPPGGGGRRRQTRLPRGGGMPAALSQMMQLLQAQGGMHPLMGGMGAVLAAPRRPAAPFHGGTVAGGGQDINAIAARLFEQAQGGGGQPTDQAALDAMPEAPLTAEDVEANPTGVCA